VFAQLRQYPKALILSVLLHVGLLSVIFISLDFDDEKKLIKQGEMSKTVKAQVVDVQQLEASKAKKQAQIDKKKKAQEDSKKRQLEADKKKREEAKRKADAKKKKQAEEKRKQAEAKKKAEVKKKQEADALKKKQAEAKAKEADKKRKLAEVKHKKELEEAKAAEAKRIADEKKKAEAKRLAEEKRLADEKKKQEAEKRRIAEEEQKRKQDELRARMEAEETQRRLSSERDAYRLAIQQKIERNWTRPQESGKFPECEVRVLQGPGGIILDVEFGACAGGTNTYRASIENAVYKAEPLPKPSDPALFDRELNINFRPK